MRRAAALLAALALLAACASAPPPDAQIIGVALTRQPAFVPPDAVFEAALLAWERDGSPPTVLARQRIADAGAPPYPLRLAYRQAEIITGRRHAVRASVSWGDRRWLQTAGDDTVLLDPALRRVDVLLAPVPPLPATARATVALERTWWRLVDIVGSGAPAPPAEHALGAHLLLDGDGARVSGSGGCNRFVGHYALQGAALRFMRLAASLRLCLDGGGDESVFFERLGRVASYWQRDDELELRDGDGKPLLRLRATERGLPPLPPPATLSQ